MNIEAKILTAIHQHQMCKNGDTVIVACSGGADSVALFRFLLCAQKSLGIRLRAAHVNHGVRTEALADEAFVRALCAEHHVPLDVCTLSSPHAFSEEWGRNNRYAFFEKLAQTHQAKVATAHTLNDQAETVLLHLTRGAGVHGAAGIPPVRGVYMRPMLSCDRTEIEAYLATLGQPYVTDASNFTDVYARNRVRLQVMPELEQVNSGAAQALARFASHMAETACYLDTQAQLLLQQAQIKLADDNLVYDTKQLLAAPLPVRRTALRCLITPYADPTEKRLLCCEQALQKNGCVCLSDRAVFQARQSVVRIELSAARHEPTDLPLWEDVVKQGGFTAQGGAVFTLSAQSYEKFINFKKQRKKVLKNVADYDKIQNNPCLRTRLPGDTFAPAGRGVTKRLKDVFSEAKLGLLARQQTPVLASGSTILWAAGFGFAQSVLPTADTKRVLVLEKTEETE